MTPYEMLLAEYENNLDIEERHMINEGLYCDEFVWINRDLPEKRKLCILAEEIGHYETSVGNILDLNDIDNARQEHRARIWAYNCLLSMDDIFEAAKKGHTEVWDMAEYLNIDEKFLREYLVYQGILDANI